MLHALANCYETLRRGDHLDEADLARVRADDIKPFQLASLAVQLLHAHDLTSGERDLLAHITAEHPAIARHLAAGFGDHPWVATVLDPARAEDDLGSLLRRTGRATELGRAAIGRIVADLVAERIDLTFLAAWLMTVCQRGLSAADTEALTLAMRDSGRIHDYRGCEALSSARIIRRYPTGSLSEKAALLLPSLLASVSDRYPIATAFVVARSLAYTGGTWDKLKAIPGFTFPDPGDASIAAMRASAVAMSVTHGDVNPADRRMYQFRSITGTVESHELIVSSIASKQLALPADLLLMDVRYGPGAFVATRAEGERMGEDLRRLIERGGVPCCYHLTDTPEPNGSAVGNALEVLEAIALMRPDRASRWDPRGLAGQLELVLTFFAILMERTFPGPGEAHYHELGRAEFASGRVFESFLRVLAAHGVGADTLAAIRADPEAVIGPKVEAVPVRAARGGALKSIDQKRLGNLVNFGLGGGGNDYAGSFDPTQGVVIHKRLGDEVRAGEPLCSLYAQNPSDTFCADLAACFAIEAIRA